jgi:hypothetical protein
MCEARARMMGARHHARRVVLRPLAAVLFALVLAAPAAAAGYANGFYSGRTSQGKTLSFVVAHGKVSELVTQIVDSCHPGSVLETLTPHTASISRRDAWFHRAAELPRQPTIYHGRLRGRKASGTITDTSDNTGRACHGHSRFSARPGSPLRLGPATVGANGTDVLLHVTVPVGFDGNTFFPDTSLGLLVYGTNTGCRASYAAADSLARASSTYLSLISDAYVSADWSFAAIKRRSKSTFTFDVSTNTLLPTATGASPYSTVCAMLYSGKPASLNPKANIALAQIHARLVPGAGPPTNQP